MKFLEHINSLLNKEFKADSNDIKHFKNNRVSISVGYKPDVSYRLDLELKNGTTMMVTHIKENSILNLDEEGCNTKEA